MNYKVLITSILFLFFYMEIAQAKGDAVENPTSDWFSNYVNVVSSHNSRFGPVKARDIFLEYEFDGRQKMFDFWGDVDIPKFFGTASDGKKGIWDAHGVPLYLDLQARMSINSLFGLGENKNLFKEYFISTNYIGNFGKKSDKSASHVLWLGLGASINTHSKLSLNINGYFRKNFSDYGSLQENNWKGYRLKMKWAYPITSLFGNNGGLTYSGHGDYDFGTGKEPKVKPSNNTGSNDALEITNTLDLSYKRIHFATIARYWYHGGGNKNNGGTLHVHASGWGCYFVLGYKL
ncbi:MAG: hypothetical protein LBH58_13500 [Tannerellaceae bacterium]|jgi:nucleoside-specific channel-forming protein|nr:hypothetical protein [Tannerellaceae bacterium]